MKIKNIKIPLYLLVLAFSILLALPTQQASAATYNKNKDSILIDGTQTIISENTPDMEVPPINAVVVL
ncbi:hypothetical protein ACP0AK_10315 [Listeria ivanovii]|uniref:Uncharacterized protein n=1 Tax=Listeria ivanovii (strain ATCC BAA-678 / PAM 55) TaxID=881621 RepID=G2Z990_LISIP|nr:hypothetical protein [Listeria ivanovii]AHI57337.1 hypothetical protein AX25_14330 [Listeria ivanovii WSLC3009]AIS66596.1 hypothetical protein JL52_14105 [Listeria ivanovii subsp. ivanovii]MBC1759731.1 hypothetical protein [Listeria ivanovii]MBK3914865.1 hypothetical protein [Listeria ivanovii subsp. ivanovii]MBK3921975.1 hypothetical protein [Listeria ivanovii subsp. ivanovii]